MMPTDPGHRRMQRRCSSKFSILASTEEIHEENRDNSSSCSFNGPYAHIRKDLDYSHHSKYTKNRQWLQDSIIEKLLKEFVVGCDDDTAVPKVPLLVYIIGLNSSSEKNFVIKTLIVRKKFPIIGAVLVDPQEICRLLPEYSRYIEHSGEVLAKSLTFKESGYISEILTRAALQHGSNVLIYTKFSDIEWHKDYFRILKEEFQPLKIAVLHITSPKADRDNSLNSKKRRKITEAVSDLTPWVDYLCTLGFSHEDPDSIIILTAGVTWDSFQDEWRQEPAYIPFEKRSNFSQSILSSQSLNLSSHRGDTNFIKQFSIEVSTEDNYKSNDVNFYGPYAHIRKTLDYTYHCNYRRERQFLQDSIISDTLNLATIVDKFGSVCTTPTEPFLVFTAGAMGAGKSYTLNSIHDKYRFPLAAFVKVDPDEIRMCFPEYSLYVEHDAFKVGELTRKEAGYITEILTFAALQAGKNVLVDGSLKDHAWYAEYISSLRVKYPKLRISILHIVAPKDAIFERAKKRALVTGRAVPREALENAIVEVPKSVAILRNSVDYYCALNNKPGVDDITILTEGITWDDFASNWNQTCAWIPKKKTTKKLVEDL